jgi:ATP-dependent RNA helicase DHX57
MSPALRDLVESIIRTMAARFPSAISSFDGTEMSDDEGGPLLQHFLGLGFRRGYVESAFASTAPQARSKESLLQHLLVHVPEDDLPDVYRDRKPADADVRFETTLDVAERWMVDRICKEAGYPRDIVQRVVKDVGNNQGRVLDRLGRLLIGETEESGGQGEEETETGIEERRADEEIALQALYDERFVWHSETCFDILVVPSGDTHVKDTVSLRAFFHPDSTYPFASSSSTLPSLPTVFVISDTLPAYIRLHLTSLVLRYARSDLADLLESGQGGVVAELVEYLSAVYPDIVDHPPDSRQVFSSLYGLPSSTAKSPGASSPSQNKKLTRGGRRPHRPNARVATSAEHEELKRAFEKLELASGYQAMLEKRKSLPAWTLRDQLVHLIQQNRVVMWVNAMSQRRVGFFRS